MSEPTPESPPPPAAGHRTFLDYVKTWFVRDVEPDLKAMRADIAALRRLTPELKVLADVIVLVAKVAAPAAAPEIAVAIAAAEEAAKVVAQIAGELQASGKTQ